MTANDFSEGDLIEATKTDVASSTRMRGVLKSSGTFGLTLRAQGYEPAIKWLETQGFILTLIEKATPPLPTEPGAYASNTGSVHVLTSSGQWLDFSAWNGSRWAKLPTNYAPFTRLRPEAEVAAEVLAEVRGIFGGPDALLHKDIDKIAARWAAK